MPPDSLNRRACPIVFRHVIDAVFTAWQARLHRFCACLLRSEHDAEEVVQEVFAQLLRRKIDGELQDPGVLLFRMARHRCIDRHRKKRPTSTADLDPATEERRENLDLQAALSELPATEREALLLTAVEGLGYREVAAILGCAVGTVAARRAAAITFLRRRLSP